MAAAVTECSGRKLPADGGNFLRKELVGFAIEQETKSEEKRVKLVQYDKNIVEWVFVEDVQVERDYMDILKSSTI